MTHNTQIVWRMAGQSRCSCARLLLEQKNRNTERLEEMFRVRAEQRDGYSGGFLRFAANGVSEVWDDTATVFDTLEDAGRWARATACGMDNLRESGKKVLRRSIISLTVMGPLGDMGGYIIESHLDSLH